MGILIFSFTQPDGTKQALGMTSSAFSAMVDAVYVKRALVITGNSDTAGDSKKSIKPSTDATVYGSRMGGKTSHTVTVTVGDATDHQLQDFLSILYGRSCANDSWRQ